MFVKSQNPQERIAYVYRHAGLLVLPVVALLSGCVALNIGSPESFTHTETIREADSKPKSINVRSAQAQLEQHDRVAVVGLSADVEETFETRTHTETFVATKQKRLAVGLFPGAAEIFLMPEGALRSGWFLVEAGWDDSPQYHLVYAGSEPPNETLSYVFGFIYCTVGSVGLIPATGTLQALLLEPFSSWSCSHDYYDTASIKRGHFKKTGGHYWDVSQSPKLQALNRFPYDVRQEIGVMTCFDDDSYHGTQMMRSTMSIGHWGLLGCHKYIALFVDPVKVGPTISSGEMATVRTGVKASGPMIVDLAIPSAGFMASKTIAADNDNVLFALPAVERDCTVEAVVSFREDASVNGRSASDLTRQALAKAAGREWRFDLSLKGTGRAGVAPSPGSMPTPRQQEQPFEVETIQPKGDGRYFVRVAVKDQSKTFSVLHSIKPEVSRLVREDFQSGNPSVPLQYIRENMRYETEKGGKFLTFTGWAFSVRPVEDGWQYDHESRRGWVRLRIGGGMPAEEAKRWARENIAAIVSEKNVAIESGKAPPPGATYRSLGEKFENDVLTVEFEAVQ